jgi:hypothetical protein
MPAPAKLWQIAGLTAKEEATYGVAVALTTTADGVQMQYDNRDMPWLTLNYTFDGDLGPAVGNLGTVLRAGKGGQSVTFEAPTRAKGYGTAYSATNKPSIHALLKAAGFDAASVTTASAEKWTYTPTAPGVGYTSLTANLYGRGELAALTGVLCDWSFDAPSAQPPMHRFAMSGLLNADISDVTTPTITYPNTAVQPPLAQNVTLVVGNFTTNAVAKSCSFALGREIMPRAALSGTTGHLGFIGRGRMPEAKVVLESTALVSTPFHSAAGFDPYQIDQDASSFSFSIQFGATQYNRWKLSFPQAQVVAIAPQVVDGVACMELTIRGYCSTPVAADDVSVLFD